MSQVIIIVTVYLVFFSIGKLINTDILNAITFYKDGFTISFIGVILLLVTSNIIYFIIKRFISIKAVT